MCLGIPMQVIEVDGLSARCTGRGGEQTVDISLVGDVAPGAWLMVFLGSARDIMSEEDARRSSDALEALEMAMRGETNFDHLFADLIGREPSLPDFLQPATGKSTSS